MTHGEIMDALRASLGVEIRVAPGAPTIAFPMIETGNLDRLGAGPRTSLLSMLDELAAGLRS